MRSLLKQQGLWALLTAKGMAKKADEKDDEWVTLDEKAHSTIMLCLSDDVIIEVTDQETAAALWTNVVCKVVGIGYIRIRTHDEVFCTLSDVRHVPQMTKNLISLSTFDSKGFNFKGEGGVMHIMKCSKVVLTVLKQGNLYILKGSIVTGSADTASSEIPTEYMTKLWNMRLGHMGEQGMQILSTRDFLSGYKVKYLDFCEHCVLGKIHRNKFPKKGKLEPRAKNGVFVGYGEGVKGYRIWSSSENKVIHNRNVVFDENSMLNSVVKSVGTENSGSVDKQVELQVTHDQSESQLQSGEDQHTTAETTGSDIHPEARQRSIAIDRARRTCVKPPQKYGFEDMLA
ncbi:hypothetical protein SASPL_156612 [Salvia splendens]|uniref:GAG-pre-integrase domain-containing protein n=1 Tax=Salvia splendens TaxID=180675 RepID=A0A8X8VWE0_SALSN|nr:hypothetical protein SASPL_156612 [Salvia splendens]